MTALDTVQNRKVIKDLLSPLKELRNTKVEAKVLVQHDFDIDIRRPMGLSFGLSEYDNSVF